MASKPFVHLGIIPTMATFSPDVFINGQPALRDGDVRNDNYPLHSRGSNIFINGKPAIIVGDLLDTTPITSGSPDTFGGEL